MSRLLENKNHLIDKLDLTPAQKEEIKAFFLKHPSYENKIDWNNKSLQYKDFEPLLAKDRKSKTQARKNGLPGLIEGKDYVDFGEVVFDNDEVKRIHIYQPLSYLGSKTLASNKVPPIKDAGAKWCISYQKTDEYWDAYTNKGIKFLFVFTCLTKFALTIYPESLHYENEVYTFEDEKIGWPSWCNLPEIKNCIENLREVSKPSLDDLLEKYKGILVKNSDGTIDKVTIGHLNLDRFIDKGRFICQFNNWRGDFRCEEKNLVTLEGAPKTIINGDFNCLGNHLTSLKGAPKKVGGNFYCDHNQLTTLEGAPEKIERNFECSFNSLTSLKGCPKEIGFTFDCRNNPLNSLEGAPLKIGGYFNCDPSLEKEAKAKGYRIWGNYL